MDPSRAPETPMSAGCRHQGVFFVLQTNMLFFGGPKWPKKSDFGGFLVGSRLLGMVMRSELVQSVSNTSPDMCGAV